MISLNEVHELFSPFVSHHISAPKLLNRFRLNLVMGVYTSQYTINQLAWNKVL
jgi:hypothetical protein